MTPEERDRVLELLDEMRPEQPTDVWLAYAFRVIDSVDEEEEA